MTNLYDVLIYCSTFTNIYSNIRRAGAQLETEAAAAPIVPVIAAVEPEMTPVAPILWRTETAAGVIPKIVSLSLSPTNWCHLRQDSSTRHPYYRRLFHQLQSRGLRQRRG